MITYYIETQVPVVFMFYMLVPIAEQVKFFQETIYD
jgi:hypothetical protein